MKVALPEKFEYQSTDKKIKLVYVPGKDPVVKRGLLKKSKWKGVRPDYASNVLISKKLNRAYFVGSYGDSGMGLGQVHIYHLDSGKLMDSLDLKKQIPDLEERSRKFRDSTNFPWISDIQLSPDENNLKIKVCNELEVSISGEANTVKVVAELKWFRKQPAQSLQVRIFEKLSDKKPAQVISIDDANYINSLQTSLNQLPKSGDMYKDFSEQAKLVELEFSSGEIKDVIEFYDTRIKTPATSFYSGKENAASEIEKEVEALITQKSNLEEELPYYVGSVRQFADFSIKYLGSEDRTPKDTTVTSWVETFVVTSNSDKKEQKIEVRSGQLPPRPVDFVVGEKKYTLSNFNFKGKNIRARSFVVSQN